MKKSGGGSKHPVYPGMDLKRHNPPGCDKSMDLKGGSVNADATRGAKPAPTPKSIGPRTA